MEIILWGYNYEKWFAILFLIMIFINGFFWGWFFHWLKRWREGDGRGIA